MFISIMLGSSLNEQIPISISETWWMFDDGKQRHIALRPCKSRKPMKSRMFDTEKASEFIWTYNAVTNEGKGIADWFAEWESTNAKIAVPK